MDLDHPNFLTSLVAIGHMTQMCPGQFGSPVKSIVSRFIVKELLMQDRVSKSRVYTIIIYHLIYTPYYVAFNHFKNVFIVSVEVL